MSNTIIHLPTRNAPPPRPYRRASSSFQSANRDGGRPDPPPSRIIEATRETRAVDERQKTHNHGPRHAQLKRQWLACQLLAIGLLFAIGAARTFATLHNVTIVIYPKDDSGRDREDGHGWPSDGRAVDAYGRSLRGRGGTSDDDEGSAATDDDDDDDDSEEGYEEPATMTTADDMFVHREEEEAAEGSKDVTAEEASNGAEEDSKEPAGRAVEHRFVPPAPDDGKGEKKVAAETAPAAAERVPGKEAAEAEAKGPGPSNQDEEDDPTAEKTDDDKAPPAPGHAIERKRSRAAVKKYTLSDALTMFDTYDLSAALFVYDPPADGFVTLYDPVANAWEASRHVRVRDAVFHSLRSLFPGRFAPGSAELVVAVGSGDYPQVNYRENDCLANTEDESKGPCVPDGFPPVLQFGSVFRHPDRMPSTIAMPMPERNHLGCFHRFLRDGEACKLYAPRSARSAEHPENRDNPLGLVFPETAGLAWDDLVPQVVWRATDRGFLSRMIRGLRRPDFGRDVRPALDEDGGKTDANVTATRAMRRVYDEMVPRWKGVVWTAEAEREAEEEARKRGPAAGSILPWCNIKYATVYYMKGVDDSAYYNKFMEHGIPAIGERMGLETLAKYKYHMDIGGGGGTTWSGTLEKLALPGLLFHHVTPTKDYNHDLIEPWVHYVPLREDLKDLREKYEWAEGHPEEARAISERATELVRSLGTKEGFEKVFNEYYVEPLRRVVEAYEPLKEEDGGASSWREFVRRRRGDNDGLRIMAECGGYGVENDCEEAGNDGKTLSLETRRPMESKVDSPASVAAAVKSPRTSESKQSSTQTASVQSKGRDHPRIAHLSSAGSSCEYNKCQNPTPSTFESELGEHKEPPSDQELPNKAKFPKSCVQGRAWHSLNPLNCNVFHEIDAGAAHEEDGDLVKFLAHGGRRDAWELDRPYLPSSSLVQQQSRSSDRVNLKTLRWDQPYDGQFFENQRRDALALERLSDSPHIIDVYGYCGMSTLNEFAGNGNLYKYIVENGEAIDPKDLLVYARNISIGLADIHEIDMDHPEDDHDSSDPDAIGAMPPGMPTLLQYDFRHHNMLLTEDGRVKISDFNIAQLLRWDTAEEKACGYWWDHGCGKSVWGTDRAPEECLVRAERKYPISDKTEVFHLGNVLNFMLSRKKHPFVSSFEGGRVVLDGEDKTEYDVTEASMKVRELLLKGVRPPLPTEILQSDDPAIKALVEARDKALLYEPDKRASAREIANILDGAVDHTSSSTNNGDANPFPQNDRGLHKLEFVHIAKTG